MVNGIRNNSFLHQPKNDQLLHYISSHGLPLKITSDRGTEFRNTSFEDFCTLHKNKLHYTTAKNSNCNFPVERLHSTIAEEIDA